MIRRLSTLLAAVCVAVLIYAITAGLIFHRLTQWLAPKSLTGQPRVTTAPPGPAGWPPPEVLALYALLSLVPAAWIGFSICFAYQRHHREKLGLCVDCGYRLPSLTKGKCPRCGLRVGPG